jgi:hypothetical protein
MLSQAGARLAALTDPEPPADQRLYVLSYLGLRKGVGVISLALPFVLVVGKRVLDGGGMQGSISAYYYTSMRNYFVGSLCALAVFLFSYKYAPRDNFLSTVTAMFALGVVFFPTTPPGQDTTWTGVVHLVCAASFFLLLAYFAYFVFTRPPLPREQVEARKRTRNRIYRVCGVTVVVCLLLVPVSDLAMSASVRARVHPLFWLETVAILAFSTSWLVKGGFLYADRSPADGGSVADEPGARR